MIVCAQPPQTVTPVPQSVVEKRLNAYVTTNAGREPAVRALFEDAGCSGPKLTEQAVKGLKAPNLICTLSGTTEYTIVVGAHFDLVETGRGVADNWSGASLLASLYQGLATVDRRHTFRFVSFGGEEAGLIGSTSYVKQLRKAHEKPVAMVNLDTLGLAETEVWASTADPHLIGLLKATAANTHLPLSAMNVDKIGTTDSEPFRMNKIPSITLHTVTQANLPILHSSRDRIEAINLDMYYRTYRLVLTYLAVLDQNLESAYSEKAARP